VKLPLGKLAYHAWYKPRGFITAVSKRGWLNSWVDREHHREMRRVAATLPCPDVSGQPTYQVHFLTGRRFWHQTNFCAWSLSKLGAVNIAPVIHDDGTIDESVRANILAVFPLATFQMAADAERRLDEFLPRERFPTLRSRRDVYPNLRKLMDVHAGSTGWKLVLDSDMLFFRSPEALLSWLKTPDRPCHMVDSETSYGYSIEFLSRQCGERVAERVNVGITGLCSDEIDWDRLEAWMAEQNATYGPHYYQEQAVIAQLMAGQDPLIVDEREYLVQPGEEEVRSPKCVLHHYVATSKPWYYRYGWRNAMRAAEGESLNGFERRQEPE
jgi:hypothetical protein